MKYGHKRLEGEPIISRWCHPSLVGVLFQLGILIDNSKEEIEQYRDNYYLMVARDFR